MKKLEQIRQESKEIKDKIDDTEERLIIMVGMHLFMSKDEATEKWKNQ